jgi:hypothetical protein
MRRFNWLKRDLEWLALSAVIFIAITALAPQQEVALPDDESAIQTKITNDVDHFIVVNRTLSNDVASLNNDQHDMIALLRTKVKWWADCAKDKQCWSWIEPK